MHVCNIIIGGTHEYAHVMYMYAHIHAYTYIHTDKVENLYNHTHSQTHVRMHAQPF